MIDDFAIIAFTLLYNFDSLKIRVSSSRTMISFFIIVIIWSDQSRSHQSIQWRSRYLRNPRTKLFSNRERSAKPYSAYSASSALTFNMTVSMIEVILSDQSNRGTSSTYSSFNTRDIWGSYPLLRAFFFRSLIDLTETSVIACTTLIAIPFSTKANAWRRCLTCRDRFWGRFWSWFGVDSMVDRAWGWFWDRFWVGSRNFGGWPGTGISILS